MQIAIIDYRCCDITVFTLDKRVEERINNEEFTLDEYIESLSGYGSECYYMAYDGKIEIRIGKQKDFPEYYLDSEDIEEHK